MFSFFNKKPVGQRVTFSISGMHCSSCAMTIDSELEEVVGVRTSATSYAKSKVMVEYDPQKVTQEKLMTIIEDLGYTVEP